MSVLDSLTPQQIYFAAVALITVVSAGLFWKFRNKPTSSITEEVYDDHHTSPPPIRGNVRKTSLTLDREIKSKMDELADLNVITALAPPPNNGKGKKRNGVNGQD